MKRRAMPSSVRARLDSDLQLSRQWERDLQEDAAWAALEEAHVLSQPWALAHVTVHVRMLKLAWRMRDRREIVGQLVRFVVAAPGSAIGRYPACNSGRANVPMTMPMPVPAELRDLLQSAQ